MNDPAPKVRPLEAMAVEHDGQRMVALSSPDGLAPGSALVTVPAFYLITLMDGARGVEAMCRDFKRQFGQNVRPGDVRRLVAQLDEALLLDNERYRAARASAREEFLNQPERPAALAGISYPADPKELGAALDSLVAAAPEPGGGEARAIIVPHIDFRVGAGMMARAWKAVEQARAELYVVLGVGHSLTDEFFACLPKAHQTPLGTLPVARGFLDRLAAHFGGDIRGQMEACRAEHSIEFAALFAARLAARAPGAELAPVILSFPEMVWELEHPVFNGERVNRFIEALRLTLAEERRRVVVVASVDFAHVGARFGDGERLTPERLAEVERDDHELIAALVQPDAGRFLEVIRRINPRNRVCGFPALYALLSAVSPGEGRLLEYRQNIEGDMENMVSFAALTMR